MVTVPDKTIKKKIEIQKQKKETKKAVSQINKILASVKTPNNS